MFGGSNIFQVSKLEMGLIFKDKWYSAKQVDLNGGMNASIKTDYSLVTSMTISPDGGILILCFTSGCVELRNR